MLEKLHIFYYLFILFALSCSVEEDHDPLFKKISAEHSGVNFNNEIIEDETHNILNFTNLYTGSGVGIGDFNNDGLEDIFFGGNMVSSALYLNRGDLHFEDITQSAKLVTERWVTGVSVVDINQDGNLDIYLSVSGFASPEMRKNLLFINQGGDQPVFVESAEQFGLADTSQITHTAFFDYDKDGDLDAIMVVNPTDYKLNNVNTIRKKKVNGEAPSTDRLYQNNGDGTFTDVSRQAGILIEGYSLGLNVSDLNNDGWSDIYITNDFLPNDILYINNQDGTFTNQAETMLKHTSFASMGLDVADINNDAFPEIYVADMYPEDNYRQKMIMSAGGFDRFYYMTKAGYQPQYSRNTLQLNNQNGTFSEIGQLLDIHQTDWSWSVLFADYDNDGWRDLYVTNGFRRDLGSLDYINYGRNNPFGSQEAVKQRLLENIKQQPGAKLPNYIFRNKEKGRAFIDKSQAWGLNENSYSHGAAYADLDLDGDLDLIVNNVSQQAFLYENQTDNRKNSHYLHIKLDGEKNNLQALGAKVYLFAADEKMYQENTPYRGYESSLGQYLHFGLGNKEAIDSVEVIWNSGYRSVIENPTIDTILYISQTSSVLSTKEENAVNTSVFREQYGIKFKHKEDDVVDFKIQSLLPHQHSLQGPCVAVGDINGDSLEDFYIGGAAKESGIFFIQNEQGEFAQKKLNRDLEKEDTNATFFDADGDGDLDLFVVSGGVLYSNQAADFRDRLYLNNGNGDFLETAEINTNVYSSGNALAISDINQDGYPDIFVGGRVGFGDYPATSLSVLLINDGKGNLTDSLVNLMPDFRHELITDALFEDIDQDGDEDLIVVGEWMPMRIYEHKNEQFLELKNPVLATEKGWWNCIRSGDFDKDGDLDFLLGNLGLNTNLKASKEQPLRLYADDYDKNGSVDPVMTQYVDNKQITIQTRDQLIGQIPLVKAKFNDYASFANADFEQEIYPILNELRPDSNELILEATNLASVYLENKGKGDFAFHDLEQNLQLAPIQDFLILDLDRDGNLDVLAVGNSYATEVNIGRYDAFTGAYMKGDGKGNFVVQTGINSGFYTDKDARQISMIKAAQGHNLFLVGNNSDSLQIFTTIK